MEVGRSIPRVDAADKVTGRAKYTDDLCPRPVLEAKILHSTIANGWVKSMDISAAQALPGVVKVLTCFDVPDIQYPTPGHPWSVEKAHQDVSDRKLLNRRVRIYGDDIAAVVAEDEITARRALELIRVEYEEYPVVLEAEQAMAEGAPVLHEEHPDNVLAKMDLRTPMPESDFHSVEDVLACPAYYQFRGRYDTQQVQHCHIENPISYAWMEGGRIVVVTSTQIPHIVRRVIGQAMGIGWGSIRVIKPYIGGGFGNKQDVLYEPLNAYLTTVVGGRPVRLEISREETIYGTRTRHAIDGKCRALATKDGKMLARKLEAYANNGGYASHGHAICANCGNVFKDIYQDRLGAEIDCYTVWTSTATAGAMRGYGIPQAAFLSECLTDDVCRAIGADPLAFRMENCMGEGFVDPANGITFHSYGLKKCMEEGAKYIGWEEKRRAYANQTGPVRRGVGMAIFCYKTGVYPISLETASARMILNQDGSMQLQLGATEIGQGADTAFSQMAAETTGISLEKVYIVSTQDTDTAPFDTGAYASRQTYVTGMAVKKCAQQLKARILDYAGFMLGGRPTEEMDVAHDHIVEKATGKELLDMETLALTAFYSLERSEHITAEVTNQCRDNSFSSGCCFVEVEVDMPLGQVTVKDIVNVHDSGMLINPELAEAQVHGGMSMGLGYGLSEEFLYNDAGRPLNDNLLDYKIPTAMDTPDLHVKFIQLEDPTGPYGNKSLGEPPAIPVAPALRNAVLHATGVAMDTIPMTPQRLIEAFQAKGLI